MKSGERTIPVGKPNPLIVRISYIDAPRKWQELRFESWYALVNLCNQARTQFTPTGHDKQGYLTGTLTCNGVSAARKQVEQEYGSSSGPNLCAVEAQARAAKKGMEPTGKRTSME